MNPPFKVEALLFDVFGTVVDWRTSIIHELKTFADQEGLDRDWHAFADAWRAHYQPSMDEVRSGRRSWANLDTLHHESLLTVLDEFSISQVSDDQIEHLNTAWHRLEPWPDAVPGLARLRAIYTLATLSNGNVALLVNMAKRAGLPWDAVLGAEPAMAYKPLPEAYLKTVQFLGLETQQCMMVAAHNDDLVHASALGLRTAFVSRPTEHGPTQTKDLRATDDWDVVATSLTELAGIMGC